MGGRQHCRGENQGKETIDRVSDTVPRRLFETEPGLCDRRPCLDRDPTGRWGRTTEQYHDESLVPCPASILSHAQHPGPVRQPQEEIKRMPLHERLAVEAAVRRTQAVRHRRM